MPSRFWDFLEEGMDAATRRLAPGAGLERRLERHLLEPGVYYLWRPSF